MSQQLINRSRDLSRLRAEGYEVAVRGGHLLLGHVPYITTTRSVDYGTLVSTLELAGDVTARPGTHVAMFVGSTPCDQNGQALSKIINSSKHKPLAPGLDIDHTFSSKPESGYVDYYDKMTTYANILSGPAQALDPTATAKTFLVPESEGEESVFKYVDTASSRAGIEMASAKLAGEVVAIVGLGGTGSYILDLIAKTPVREIHLYDGDRFSQHNAFRSPGAPSVETLRKARRKVDYLLDVYANMRRGIFGHDHLGPDSVGELANMDFVFIAVDNGEARKMVVDRLLEDRVPFVDVGMGVFEDNACLSGQIRVTTAEGEDWENVRVHIPQGSQDGRDDYSRNIQVAELNALNAALAVVKWKKTVGYYADLECEHHTVYQIDGNFLINEIKNHPLEGCST